MMTKYIIRVIGTDGRRAWLNRNIWAADQADATRYDSRWEAGEMATHFLAGQAKVLTWVVLPMYADADPAPTRKADVRSILPR
jgi:hypothetical protein